MNSLFPRHWPVRWRIAAVSAGLTLLILLTFALIVGRLATGKLNANFEEEAQSAANDLANRFQIDPGPTGAGINTRGFDFGQAVMPPSSTGVIIDGDGMVIKGAADAHPGTVPVPGEPETVGDVTVASQLIQTNALGVPPVYVEVVRDRDYLEGTTDRLWLFLAGGVLGGTLLSLLAGLAVAQRAMSPIASLTAAAREVTMTRDPSKRIPMPDTDDEVAELARTLDKMLRELDAARSETEQMVQAQRDFVADASHELRTPLTSVLANLELLEARFKDGDDPEDVEIVSGALGSARRMRRLVSDLLLLARADAGRAGPRRICELGVIAEAAIGEVRAVSDGHKITLEARDTVEVQGNPDDLHRLVLNLVENAVRHTPSGTRVDTSVRGGDGAAVIEVSDEGPGIPDDLDEQIFARFVRGSGPADLATGSGTGLGLAIVKAVATAHGGTVELGTSPAGGARLTVRMPLATVDKQTLTKDPAPVS